MDSSAYYRAITASDDALKERQRQISSAHDAGHITTREAVDLRVNALTAHLTACREARQRFLSDGVA